MTSRQTVWMNLMEWIHLNYMQPKWHRHRRQGNPTGTCVAIAPKKTNQTRHDLLLEGWGLDTPTQVSISPRIRTLDYRFVTAHRALPNGHMIDSQAAIWRSVVPALPR